MTAYDFGIISVGDDGADDGRLLFRHLASDRVIGVGDALCLIERAFDCADTAAATPDADAT